MEFGYDSVSLEQIAAAAGVTKASVYYYFHNKAELFAASVIHMMSYIGSRTSALLDAPGTFRERLASVAEAYMQHAHIDFESLMREAGPALTREQTEGIREAERSIHEVLAAAFRKEMKQGEVREGDPLLYAYAFSALMMLGARGDASGGERSGARQAAFPDLTAEGIVDLFWTGAGRMV
ncbi:TetR/AcrR family transcriptional regulator [Paenibacillus sp. IB182363]|uniref:TetR/AcrR family transcriptional regulator n=2 Tax=Paenibacillus oceani TaxID=2772510 RepID=A0A927CAS7_9BACL|nr:TetR/AcrR family transcriptional regulator [Paenibacillus oceani]